MQSQIAKKKYDSASAIIKSPIIIPDVSEPFLDINKTLMYAKKNDEILYKSIIDFTRKYPNTLIYDKHLIRSQEITIHDQSTSFGISNRKLDTVLSHQMIQNANELNDFSNNIRKQIQIYDDTQLKFNQSMHDVQNKIKLLDKHVSTTIRSYKHMNNDKKSNDVENNNAVKRLSFGLVIGICGFLSATAIFILPFPFNFISALSTLGPISAGIIRLKSIK